MGGGGGGRRGAAWGSSLCALMNGRNVFRQGAFINPATARNRGTLDFRPFSTSPLQSRPAACGGEARRAQLELELELELEQYLLSSPNSSFLIRLFLTSCERFLCAIPFFTGKVSFKRRNAFHTEVSKIFHFKGF